MSEYFFLCRWGKGSSEALMNCERRERRRARRSIRGDGRCDAVLMMLLWLVMLQWLLQSWLMSLGEQQRRRTGGECTRRRSYKREKARESEGHPTESTYRKPLPWQSKSLFFCLVFCCCCRLFPQRLRPKERERGKGILYEEVRKKKHFPFSWFQLPKMGKEVKKKKFNPRFKLAQRFQSIPDKKIFWRSFFITWTSLAAASFPSRRQIQEVDSLLDWF